MAWMQSHGNFSHLDVISYELLEGEVFNSKFCINPLEPISMAIERVSLSPGMTLSCQYLEYTRTVRPDTPAEGIRTTYPGRNYTRLPPFCTRLPPTFHPDVHVRNSGAGWKRRRFNFSERMYSDHLIASTRIGEQPFCIVLRCSPEAS
uniref:Uncharacterized protein n=1 Tax=Vitis vinifera TaxID=29760 RepID=A5BTE4_VITVI|nr:hypothetical protein VITISV_024775 [Vitis vinifera]